MSCTHYCDERCARPDGHDGLCWAEGLVWREATPEEEAAFEAEAEARTEFWYGVSSVVFGLMLVDLVSHAKPATMRA